MKFKIISVICLLITGSSYGSDPEIFYEVGSAIKIPKDNSPNQPIDIEHSNISNNTNKIDNIENNKDTKKYNNIFGVVDYNKEIMPINSKIEKSEVLDLFIESHGDNHHDENFDDLIEQASLAFKLGHIEVATSFYENILDIDKNNISALMGLATILHQSGVMIEAKKLYTRLLSLDPGNQHALNNFLALVGEESPDKALKELRKLESINPLMSIIPAQMAMIYSNKNDYEMAIKYFNKAQILSPDSVNYRYNLAILLDKMGDKNNAIKLYRQLVRDHEDNHSLPGSVETIKNRLIYLGSSKV